MFLYFLLFIKFTKEQTNGDKPENTASDFIVIIIIVYFIYLFNLPRKP